MNESTKVLRLLILSLFVLGAASGRAQYAEVDALDLTECENDSGPFSDMCVINPGETGVDKVVFDAPVRRFLRTAGGAMLAPPIAAVAVEATTHPNAAPGQKDVLVLAQDAIWRVANDAAAPNVLNIENDDQLSNSDLVLSLGITPDYLDDFIEFQRIDTDGDGQEEVLFAWSGNPQPYLLTPDYSVTPPTWSDSHPFTLPTGYDANDIVDLHVADIDGSPGDEVVFLFDDGFSIVAAGNTTASLHPLGMPSAFVPQAITTMDADSTGALEVAVVGVTSLDFVTAVAYYEDATTFDYLQLNTVTHSESFAQTKDIEIHDVVDGGSGIGEWGIVAVGDSTRSLQPAVLPPAYVPAAHENHTGHAIFFPYVSTGLLLSSTSSDFVGGARKVGLADFGPGKPATWVDADGDFVGDPEDDPTFFDGELDIVILGEGAASREVFTVGDPTDTLNVRLGVLTLFQRGAHMNVNGETILRPTSQRTLVSARRDDDVRVFNETPQSAGAVTDRLILSMDIGQLDLGPEPEIITVDPANGDLLILRAQPQPCAVYVTSVTHGHQGLDSTLNIVPGTQNFLADRAVDFSLDSIRELVVDVNDARRPGNRLNQEADLCPIRHIEVRGHWEKATMGSLLDVQTPSSTEPDLPTHRAGNFVSISRMLVAATQYGVAEYTYMPYVRDPDLIPTSPYAYIGGFSVGSFPLEVQLPPEMVRDLGGFDPVLYQLSRFVPIPELWHLPASSAPTVPGFAPTPTSLFKGWWTRVLGDAAAGVFESLGQAGYANFRDPAAVSLSSALRRALEVARTGSDLCETPIAMDLNGFSRGTVLTHDALDPAFIARVGPGSSSGFPFSRHTRFNTNVHVNYFDAIDKNHAWDAQGMAWPWRHGGAAIGEGPIRRRGNETISAVNATSADELGTLLNLIANDAIVDTTLEVLITDFEQHGGTHSGGKFDIFSGPEFVIGAPVGWERSGALSVARASGECDGVTSPLCDYQVGRENFLTVEGQSHNEVFFDLEDDFTRTIWEPGRTGIHQGLEPLQFASCADLDFDEAGNGSVPRPANHCYHSNSNLGEILANPRGSLPVVGDSAAMVGWAPRATAPFLRTDTDETAWIPSICDENSDIDDMSTPAETVEVELGASTISDEFVRDWDFGQTGAAVLYSTALVDARLDELQDMNDFWPDFEGVMTHFRNEQWASAVWRQDPCIYDDPACKRVVPAYPSGFEVGDILGEVESAVHEGIRMSAVAALPVNQRVTDATDGYLAQMTDKDGDATIYEKQDREARVHRVFSGATPVADIAARFHDDASAVVLESDLSYKSKQHNDFMVRIDYQMRDVADGEVTVALKGEELDWSMQWFADDTDRHYEEFWVTRGQNNMSPPDLDVVQLSGRAIDIFAISVRPVRVFETEQGGTYEVVMIPGGVTWEQAKHIAGRNQFFGLKGRLLQPRDALSTGTTTLARPLDDAIDILAPHVPAWVDGRAAAGGSQFELSNGDAMNVASLDEPLEPGRLQLLSSNPDVYGDMVYPRHAFWEPRDDQPFRMLNHKEDAPTDTITDDEGTTLSRPMAFIIEYVVPSWSEPMTCASAGIDSVQIASLTERDEAIWPLEKICDGVGHSGTGYAGGKHDDLNLSDDDGFIRFNLSAPKDLSGIRLYNDFGSLAGQGVEFLEVTFLDANDDEIGTSLLFEADPNLQLQPIGPDTFMLPSTYAGVSKVDIHILSNFDQGGAYDELNIREIEFVEEHANPTRSCAVELVETVTMSPELTERHPSAWPLEDLCDGIDDTNDGYVTGPNVDSGTLTFELRDEYELTGMKLFNDFGSVVGHGVQNFDVTLKSAAGAVLYGPQTFTASAANQLVGNGPDQFTWTAVDNVKTVVIDITDNFDTSNGVSDELNIREIEFDIASQTETCSASMVNSVTAIGLKERANPTHAALWPLEDVCDGANQTNDGFATDIDDQSGRLSFELDAAYTLDGLVVYNDFGTFAGQGAKTIEITLKNGSGAVLAGPMLISTTSPDNPDSANQLQGNGPDILPFTAVAGVEVVEVDIFDNFLTTGGFDNQLNLREIEFQVAP